jgi:hypothetical protein
VLGRVAQLPGDGRETRELAAWAEAMRTGLIGFAVAGAFISAQFEKFFWVMMFLSVVVGRLAQQHAATSSEQPAAAPATAPPARTPEFA